MHLIPRFVLSSFLIAFATGSIAQVSESPPTARFTEAEAVAALGAKLEDMTAEDRFSGAVLIAHQGKPIFQAAYGYADRNKKIPNTVDTKFRFGSIGKMFTAVAIMQLVQNGKINLDDPLSKFLPDYPNNSVAAVTIRQLLTHTAGTGDIFGPDFAQHRAELKELSDYVRVYGNRGLQFDAGSRHEYSNYGFLLLGRIIEVVSGHSYYDYVREQVFKPAGMHSTDNLPEAQLTGSLAVAYTSTNPGDRRRGPGAGQVSERDSSGTAAPPLREAEDFLPYRGTSAGGGYSTVGDLLRFANAVTNHALLNTELTTLMTSGKVKAPRPGLQYAYGFEDETMMNGVRRLGHGGGAPGMNAVLSIFPSSEYVIIVIANRDPPAAQEIARFVTERLPIKQR